MVRHLLPLKKLVNSLDYLKSRFVNSLMNKYYQFIELQVASEDSINMLWRKCAMLWIVTRNHPKLISSTLGLVPKSKWMTLKDKLSTQSPELIPMIHIELYQILVLELISKEKACVKFWTPALKELSGMLSSPTETDFPDLRSISSKQLSPSRVEQSQCLTMTRIQALNKNLPKTCYQSFISTTVDKWENESIQPVEIHKCLKIRLKPNQVQKKLFNKWINTSRSVYNKVIAHTRNMESRPSTYNHFALRDRFVTSITRKFNTDYAVYTDSISRITKLLNNETDPIIAYHYQLFIKKTKERIRHLPRFQNEQVPDYELETPKAIRDGAVQDVCKAFTSCFANLKAGNIKIFELKFKEKKNPKQSCVLSSSCITKVNNGFKIYPNLLKENSLVKIGHRNKRKYKNIDTSKDIRLTYTKGEYWVHIPLKCDIVKFQMPHSKDLKICGIDPGIRTFMTTYSNTTITEYNVNNNKMKKMRTKYDVLKKKLKDNVKKIKRSTFDKLEKQESNYIDELHWKTINGILSNNDIVFYGDIKSHDIVKPQDHKPKRFQKHINRDMMQLKFFKFKQRLFYKADLMNKKVFPVSEYYTTKTCSLCGAINDPREKKQFECIRCSSLIHRDINAAKNIMLKGMMQFNTVCVQSG